MSTFITVLVLLCSNSNFDHNHFCMKDREINVRISAIEEFEPFKYKECRHLVDQKCSKTVYEGCKLTLKDREYFSEFSCDMYKQ